MVSLQALEMRGRRIDWEVGGGGGGKDIWGGMQKYRGR